MKENCIKTLHQRWELLRLYRYRGLFPIDYPILRNYIRIEAKQEHRYEA